MKKQSYARSSRKIRKIPFIIAVLALLFAMLSCNISLGEENNTAVQTQAALGAQQTMLAMQSEGINQTIAAQEALLNAQNAQATMQAQPPTPDFNATQVALSITQTAAVQPTNQEIVQSPVAPTVPPPSNPTAPPPPSSNLKELMKTANILVYEDIVTDPAYTQYVKKTLDMMGLKYKWDGNAVGRLKADLLGGAPNGQPWDLVILAIEARGNVSGEYFDYLMQVINQGTAVIIEAWHLDDISQGTVSSILTRCGVEVREYSTDWGNINDVLIWPIPPVSHPVMTTPNSGMSFTKGLDTWIYSGDLGSLVASTGNGDAQLLMSTNAQYKDSHGVLTVCMGGQMILQTFSSHSFTYQTMGPMWENYITNALRWRFEGN
jgi:hypothetical protein